MTTILSENDGYHDKFEDMRSLMKDTYRSDAVVPPHWCSAEARERRENLLPERSRAHVYTVFSLWCYCVLHHLQHACLMDALPKVLLATLMIERPLRWMSWDHLQNFGFGIFCECYGVFGLQLLAFIYLLLEAHFCCCCCEIYLFYKLAFNKNYPSLNSS